MGLRTSPMAEVVFEDCKVPVANRLGREGRGVAVFRMFHGVGARLHPGRAVSE